MIPNPSPGNRQTPRRAKPRHEALIPPPQAQAHLAEGFRQLAQLLALTLGPQQGVVVNARSGRGDPELLTDSATIARRVIQLPAPAEDAGAMLLRGMVANLEERYGDGCATASVLADAMVRRGARLLAAGANPMSLRAGIERGTAAAVAELARQACPLSGQDNITRLASLATGDPDMGQILGEIFDLMGAHGAVLIQEFYGPYLEREYLDGGRWTGRPAARAFIPDGKVEVTFENPLILVTNQELDTVDSIRPALEMAAARRPRQPLILFARNIKGDALTTLLINQSRGTLEVTGLIPAGNLFPVEEDLADIALLTGARWLDPNAGHRLENFRPDDIGGAQQVVFSNQEITIIGGAGGRAALQKQVGELRARIRQVKRNEPLWEKLRLRAARLSGGVAVLKIGATYEKERDLRKEQAQKAIRMLAAALEDGVLPGGGVAYLNCREVVRAQKAGCASPDEAFGLEIVASALEAPFRQIISNAGHLSPAVALDQVTRLGPGFGLDITSGEYVDMTQAGILDGAGVLQGALQAAASAAAMLLTTDVVVLRKHE